MTTRRSSAIRADRVPISVVVVSLIAAGTPGLLWSPAPARAIGAQSAAVSYSYDQDGRLASVTSGGLMSTYSYDAAGNIVAISKPMKKAGRPGLATKPHVPGPDLHPVRVSTRVGSLLTLHGRHFNPDPELDKVNIGRLIATVLKASPSELTVRIPPGPGGPVQVLTPAGAVKGGTVRVTGAAASPATPVVRAADTKRALQAGAGVTALSGRVETASGHGLAGVRISVNGLWDTPGKTTTTNKDGRFVLTRLTAGKHQLTVNAQSVGGTNYGVYIEPVQVRAGRTTVMPWITYLTRIDTSHAVFFSSPTKSAVVLKSPRLPGVQVRIPVGTVVREPSGKVVRSLSITPLPLDRPPFPLAPGMPTFFTLQPGNVRFSGPGIQVVYANVTHLRPGSKVPYVALNPAWGYTSWYRYGTGTVSANGADIIPGRGTVFHVDIPFGYVPQPAPNPAPPPGGQKSGEPVDLASGLYEMNATDLTLRDSQSAVLARTYREQDGSIHGFGVGMEDGFDWFVTPDPVISGDYALILPDGSRIDYAPTATSGVWDAVGSPTAFTGSVLTQGVEDVSTFIITLRSGTTYDFGAQQALLDKVTNPYGSALTISRINASGDIQTLTTPGGKWMQFTYGVCVPGSAPVNCVTQVTDDQGRTVSYSYDTDGRLTGVTDANGGHTKYTWAACKSPLTCTELLTITDPNGITALNNTYDPGTGQVISQSDADGGQWHYSYSGSGRFSAQTTVTDPRGNRTVWTFNGHGYPASETAAAGPKQAEKTQFSYNATTNLLDSVTDPLGRKTAYAYDKSGNFVSVALLVGTAEAARATYTYEPVHGRLASVTNPDGSTTKWTYDDQDRTVTQIDPLGNKTVIALNAAAEPIELTDSLGQRTYLSYYATAISSPSPIRPGTSPRPSTTGRVSNSRSPTQRATPPRSLTTRWTRSPPAPTLSAMSPVSAMTPTAIPSP